MSYDKKSFDLNLIYQVLPEYKPISSGDEPNARDELYKSICSKTGQISLIRHPKFWKEYKDINGLNWRHRPQPKLMMTYDEAKKSTTSGSKW